MCLLSVHQISGASTLADYLSPFLSLTPMTCHHILLVTLLQSLESPALFCPHCHFLSSSPRYLVSSFPRNCNCLLLICLHSNCDRSCPGTVLAKPKLTVLFPSWGTGYGIEQTFLSSSRPFNLSSQCPFYSNVWPYGLQITMYFTHNTQFCSLNILYSFPDSALLSKLPIPVFRIFSFFLFN